MSKYAEVNEVVKILTNNQTYSATVLQAIIDRIPEADVEPVRHGHWEKSNIPNEKYCCSVCGGACWYYDYEAKVAKSRFCPNCGAKMDGEVEDE